jgi:aspartate/glutamate racemase
MGEDGTMAKTLVLVHTVSPLINVFDRLAAEILPGVQRMHVLDEPLLERVRRRGRLAPEDSKRLESHVAVARQIGADAVLVTCSTISPCVNDVAPQFPIPVIKIDEAMIAEAVAGGHRIGVLATNETTLAPTCESLHTRSVQLGKPIQTEAVLVAGALPALLAGDGQTHDRLVLAVLRDLAQRSDVVVLAQASMARVLDAITQPYFGAPILSSPHLALRQVKERFAATP